LRPLQAGAGPFAATATEWGDLMGQSVVGALSLLDLVVVALSLLIVVAVGFVTSRKGSETSEGYFLAGRTLPWWMIGLSFVATSVSSEQMVGTVGVTYTSGMGIANWEWFALAYIPLMVFFLPVLLKNRITTVPEYFRQRFGPLCGDIYSWVMLVAYVFLFTVAVLYSGSLALSEITGWNFYLILILTVVLVGGYTVIGGMTSVIWTTALQCVLLLGGGTVLFFIALGHIPGGWEAMEAANPERFHLYQPPDHEAAPFLGLIMGSFGVFLFYQVGNQFMIQRILAARSTWDGILGLIFSGFINFLRPLTTCFLGLVVYHWVHEMNMAPELENPDTAFPFALKAFAPEWGLRGVILAGFIAAVMSTLSSLINSTATIFAFDVYKKKIRPDATDREVVTAAKIAALSSVLISAAVAPSVFYLGGIFTFFQTGVTYLASPFIATFIMGLMWKRTNYKAAMFGLVGGLALQVVLAIAINGVVIEKWGVNLPCLDMGLHWLYVAFIGQVTTMLGIWIVTMMSEPAKESEIGNLVWSFNALAQYDQGEYRPWYKRLKLWFCIWFVIWISIYYVFW